MNRIGRIRPSTFKSWGTAGQRWEGRSYQWVGGVLTAYKKRKITGWGVFDKEILPLYLGEWV